MHSMRYVSEVLKELDGTLKQVDPAAAANLIDLLMRSKRIFVAGAGRSGLMVKAFAMRLMHLGFAAYVVGETTTPAIAKGDVLLIGSGSGETGSLAGMAQKAKSLGVMVGFVGIFPESTIGKLSDAALQIPAPTPKAAVDNGLTSVQPMGSLFEQCLLLLLDSLVMGIMEKRHTDTGTMFKRHANLE
jgi:6-phospho-3-hexuloisomerase